MTPHIKYKDLPKYINEFLDDEPPFKRAFYSTEYTLNPKGGYGRLRGSLNQVYGNNDNSLFNIPLVYSQAEMPWVDIVTPLTQEVNDDISVYLGDDPAWQLLGGWDKSPYNSPATVLADCHTKISLDSQGLRTLAGHYHAPVLVATSLSAEDGLKLRDGVYNHVDSVIKTLSFLSNSDPADTMHCSIDYAHRVWNK